MEINKIDRNTLRLIASGQYLQLNKSFDQERFSNFVEGALFTYDLINKTTIEAKRGNNASTESDKANESRIPEKQL